jgi:hypothetical protein
VIHPQHLVAISPQNEVMWKVDKRVGNVRNNSPELALPAGL